MFKQYIDYFKDNPQGYWFKRRIFGWGWIPVKWQGWVVIVVYVVAIIYFFRKADAVSHSNSDTLIGFAVPFIVATLVLIIFCRTKGEAPKWQWGLPKEEKE